VGMIDFPSGPWGRISRFQFRGVGVACTA
jgi:hypothetical protein